VFTIFAFAVVVISAMWVYLDRHTAPFRPLRRALATEFQDSAPKVEGGQERMSKNTPVTLRIIMRVEFNPNKDPVQAKEFATRVFNFSREHHDLSKYEVVEVHFFFLDPEKQIEEWNVNVDPKTGRLSEP
jgi:hypothetical protein